MGRQYLGVDTMEAALSRLKTLYQRDDRVIVSFSAGKDSGIVLELCRMAAEEEGKLPVEVVMRDEEIMLPGTFEYAERVAAREEFDFRWVYANQPIVNAYNRREPYWWVFDPLLDPDEWVRKPPAFAERATHQNIQALITPDTYPPPPGGDLVIVMGLRAVESRKRMFGIYSSGQWVTKVDPKWRYRKARPIYDWTDGDVWKAILDNGWDYNTAYDGMRRAGMSRHAMRIAPPTLSPASIEILQVAARIWPRWFDRVAKRLPGVRTAARFGRRAVEPVRRHGETWEECFWRTCVTEAPDWIAERAKLAASFAERRHSAHATTPLPQTAGAFCPRCVGLTSWQTLANSLYMGDPFSFKCKDLREVEPEYFREGAGTWGGSPSW